MSSAETRHVSEEIRITPDKAIDILTQYQFEGQRVMRMKRVNFLVEEINQGHFLPWTTIEIAKVGDKRYLIDGQHRLQAVIDSGIPQDFIVIRRELNTLVELADVYKYLGEALPKTFADYLKAAGLSQLSPRRQNAIVGAAKLITEFARQTPYKIAGKVHLAQQKQWFTTWEPYAVQFFEDTKDYPSQKTGGIVKECLGSAILALGLITFRFQPHKAREFWASVRAGDRLPSCATRHYRDHILKYNIGNDDNSMINSRRNYFLVGVTCWNNFFTDSRMEYIRYKHLLDKLTIAGVKNLDDIHKGRE